MRLAVYFFLWGISRLALALRLAQGRKFRLLDPFPSLSVTRYGVRAKRINALLGHVKAADAYLEVGTSYGHTLQAVMARSKVGVDPNNRFNTWLTPPSISIHNDGSDGYFENVPGRFDLIYLDGLHEARQTYRDVINALSRLKAGGLILIDDVLPKDFPSSLPNESEASRLKVHLGITHPHWYGDVYKVVKVLLDSHPELGIGIFGNSPVEHGQALVWRRFQGESTIEPVPVDFDLITFDYVFGGQAIPGWPEHLSLPEPDSSTFIGPYTS